MAHRDSEIERIAGKLLAYLREQFDQPGLAYDLPLTRLLGGFETSIYRIKLRGMPEELDRSLVLRLYPARYMPDQAVWESQVQNALAREGYPVAPVHLVCTDKAILGGAFFVMDFLPGALLTTAPPEKMFGILGQAHAALHKGDPETLITSLSEQGMDAGRLVLHDQAILWRSEYPWVLEGVDWLAKHRPPEPARPAICHGDFHPLNVLVQEDTVTGVLDWAELVIADPAWDIANTILRIRMPYKYFVSGLLGPGFAAVDWEKCVQIYLDTYRAQNPAGTTNLEYYLARQSLYSLVDGVRGHVVWRHPPIAQELIQLVYQVTGVQVTIPVLKR